MRIRVQQVSISEAGAVIAGEPVNDPTKVVLAGLADPLLGIPFAMAIAAGEHPVVEPPDDAVMGVIEKPKDLL